MPVKSKYATCSSCRYAVTVGEALVCYGAPPSCVVIEGKPITMRPAVQPADRACSVFDLRPRALV